MNKTYIRSRLRDAGKGMRSMLQRLDYEAREQLQKENVHLQKLESKIEGYENAIRPLRHAADKIKGKIRKETHSRQLKARRLLDESFARATERMNTAITEPELVEARDAALVFIKQWETFEATTLKLLKGEK